MCFSFTSNFKHFCNYSTPLIKHGLSQGYFTATYYMQARKIAINICGCGRHMRCDPDIKNKQGINFVGYD